MAPIQLNDLQPGEPIFQFIETTLVIVDIDKYIGINDLKRQKHTWLIKPRLWGC
jgi:hypothetical protein